MLFDNHAFCRQNKSHKTTVYHAIHHSLGFHLTTEGHSCCWKQYYQLHKQRHVSKRTVVRI